MTERQTATKRDPILEKMAKAVFGEDIVDKAYVTVMVHSCDSKEETEALLTENLYKEESDDIDLEGKAIIIQFTNGKSVSFMISEWGIIESVDMKRVIEQ